MEPSAPKLEELLTAKEIARALKCSRKTVTRLVNEGKLGKPRLLVKGMPRWFSRDLDFYLWRLAKGDFE